LTNEGLNKAINDFKVTCNENNLFIVDEKDIPYGRQFKIKHLDNFVQVNLYFGKKGLQILTQGKDSISKKFINDIFNKSEGSRSTHTDSSQEILYSYNKPWIGIDESGKGDFFGPLVCTGVIIEPSDIPMLEKLDVKDSKKISDTRIIEISSEIKQLLKNRVNTIVLKPSKYNELYKKMSSEKKNLNSLLAWCHSTVLENLLELNKVELAISDKFGNENLIMNRLKKLGKETQLIQVTKAESNLAVATASIIARSEYLMWHKNSEKKYNIVFPKGASSSVVEAGKSYVLKYGYEKLSEVAKLHFKTIDELK